MAENKLNPHYKKLRIQPFEYSMKNGLDAMQHTAIKYVTRFRDKGGIRDLRAAIGTIESLIAYELSIDEEECLDNLIGAIRDSGVRYDVIRTKGRGGLWACAQLGYALGIKSVNPVMVHEDDRILYVDDIADTGATLYGITDDIAVLTKRYSCKIQPKYVGKVITHDEYVEFPISQQYDKENK